MCNSFHKYFLDKVLVTTKLILEKDWAQGYNSMNFWAFPDVS